MTTARVLILFAHPVLERSRVNARLIAAAQTVEGVTVHDLYDAYPTLEIDVPREQELLATHDVIVFQHPFYWYSVPAVLKEWQDLVLEYGWAYGKDGKALRGKVTLNAITTGGPAAAYRHEGGNRFTVRELLAPWDQTAHLCGMRFLAPFVVHASLRIAGDDVAVDHVRAYGRLLAALRDGTIDLERAAAGQNLRDELDDVLAARVSA